MNHSLKYDRSNEKETNSDFFLRLIAEDDEKSLTMGNRKQGFGGQYFGNSISSDIFTPSIVPFSFDGVWFGVGIDYFEMAFSTNKIYQYPYFERTLIKGMTIFNNQFLPVVNYIGALGIQSKINPNIMIMLSDTNRNIVIEAETILKPEKIINSHDRAISHQSDFHSIVLSQLRIQDRNTIILNANELIKLADFDL